MAVCELEQAEVGEDRRGLGLEVILGGAERDVRHRHARAGQFGAV
jgi:hypothetical protein